MNPVKIIFYCLLIALAQTGRAQTTNAGDAVLQLLPQAQVDSAGIFLDQIVSSPASTVVLPHLRLAPAPNLGQTASLSRSQITELAQACHAELITTNWSGAIQVRVSRRTRQLSDFELTGLLTDTLQKQFVKDRGELELHLTRPWTKVPVPDEPLTVKVSGLPAAGVCPNFVASCELWCGKELVGSWDLALRAEIWRDVPVARSTLQRGQQVKDADVTMERRDILAQRDIYLNFPTTDDGLEFTESVSAGTPLFNRSVRVRPLILRGRLVEGVFQDGTLSISLKVEALEDGSLGQTVRVINPKTRKELYGKVQNEQTVLIVL